MLPEHAVEEIGNNLRDLLPAGVNWLATRWDENVTGVIELCQGVLIRHWHHGG